MTPLEAENAARNRYWGLFGGGALQAPEATLVLAPRAMRGAKRATLELARVMPLPGVSTVLRASTASTLELRESFGGGRPAVIMRALAAVAGLDSSGRFFLSCGLAIDGAMERRLSISAVFGGTFAASWSGVVEAARATEVLVTGRDVRLPFALLDRVELIFAAN
jgi:hypothetical protein